MEMLSNKTIIIFWLAAALVGYIFGGPGVAGGIALAGILSIVIWNYTLNSSWEGVIQDIKDERMYSGGSDEDSDNDYKDVTLAHIRLSTGKLKKMKPYPDWKKGDKIRKVKGKMGPEKV